MEERERLLRDLHDGMGSSLSTARIRLEAGAMRERFSAYIERFGIDTDDAR